MPLDEIVEEIKTESKKGVAKIRAEQDAEVGRISEQASEEAKRILKSGREALDVEISERRRNRLSSIDVEKSMLLTEARERAVERELKAVSREVRRELSRNSEKILSSALKKFAKSVQKSETVIITAKKNAKMVQKLGCEVRYDASVDGFLLSNGDGSIRLNAEFSRIVEDNTETIRNMLAKRMFPSR